MGMRDCPKLKFQFHSLVPNLKLNLYLGSLWRRLLMQQWIRNYLGLEFRSDVACKQICIHFIPRSHSEPPLVLQLPTKVQVHVWYQQAIQVTRERWRARCIWCGNIARSIEMPKICMLRFPITGSECIWKYLSPNAVDWCNKVTICYGSISCLKPTSFMDINWMQKYQQRREPYSKLQSL